jgi:hypothetical protein
MDRQDHAMHACAQLHALAALLANDAVDAAIEAGLMQVQADSHCAGCADDAQRVLIEQRRLRSNWAARERYRARSARLQRRAAERQARRAPAPATIAEAASAPAPSLPPAVAAALARAKARAAGRSSS